MNCREINKGAGICSVVTLPVGLDSSSDEDCKSCKLKRSKKKSSRCKSTVFSSGIGSWSLYEIMKKAAESSKMSTTSCDTKDRVLE